MFHGIQETRHKKIIVGDGVLSRNHDCYHNEKVLKCYQDILYNQPYKYVCIEKKEHKTLLHKISFKCVTFKFFE